jgi:hypothetical protein
MGILDEAIREHLELKRQHGAGDSELRDLEDEAFGPPARPGGPEEPAFAEPAVDDEAGAAKTELLAGLQEAPPESPEPVEALEEGPAEEEQPALEHPLEPGEEDAGTVTVETEEHPPPEGAVEPEPLPEPAQEPAGEAIAGQPTELYEFGEEVPAAEEPAEPVEDEFFSEQSLSDELDQALDAPEPESEAGAAPAPEPIEEAPAAPEEGDEVAADEPEDGFEGEAAEEEGEDVLEETPEFLQDTPEHDRLWFEQKPPKDFDFDD